MVAVLETNQCLYAPVSGAMLRGILVRSSMMWHIPRVLCLESPMSLSSASIVFDCTYVWWHVMGSCTLCLLCEKPTWYFLTPTSGTTQSLSHPSVPGTCLGSREEVSGIMGKARVKWPREHAGLMPAWEVALGAQLFLLSHHRVCSCLCSLPDRSLLQQMARSSTCHGQVLNAY